MDLKSELERELKNLKNLTGITMHVDAENDTEAELAAEQIRCLCSAYREKYDRNHFLRRLLSGDIPAASAHAVSSAKHLHIEPEQEFILYLIEADPGFDRAATEILKNLFPARPKSYTVPLDPKTTALVYPAKELKSVQDIRQIACTVADTLNMEALLSVRIAYSGILPDLFALKDGYRDTALALRIGKRFYPDQVIFAYDRLGIGRLIDELPKAVCESFLTEIFKTTNPDWLDADFSDLVNRFFHCSLNIAETARQMHMHRNSLLYRLELVQKHTGLDLRRFEDAMTFRIASMILNYLHADES